MSKLRNFAYQNILCLIIAASFICLVITVRVYNYAYPQSIYARLSAKSRHSNPLNLANGEKVTITVKWNKKVKGFEVNDLIFNLVDNNGDSITQKIKDNPSLKLPEFNNFRRLNAKTYKVDLTSLFNYGPALVTGKMIISFTDRGSNNTVIGELYDNNILEFTWGSKSEATMTPAKYHLNNSEKTTIVIDFDRNVEGVKLSDIIVKKAKKNWILRKQRTLQNT